MLDVYISCTLLISKQEMSYYIEGMSYIIGSQSLYYKQMHIERYSYVMVELLFITHIKSQIKWKFGNTLLYDIKYRNFITNMIMKENNTAVLEQDNIILYDQAHDLVIDDDVKYELSYIDIGEITGIAEENYDQEDEMKDKAIATLLSNRSKMVKNRRKLFYIEEDEPCIDVTTPVRSVGMHDDDKERERELRHEYTIDTISEQANMYETSFYDIGGGELKQPTRSKNVMVEESLGNTEQIDEIENKANISKMVEDKQEAERIKVLYEKAMGLDGIAQIKVDDPLFTERISKKKSKKGIKKWSKQSEEAIIQIVDDEIPEPTTTIQKIMMGKVNDNIGDQSSDSDDEYNLIGIVKKKTKQNIDYELSSSSSSDDMPINIEASVIEAPSDRADSDAIKDDESMNTYITKLSRKFKDEVNIIYEPEISLQTIANDYKGKLDEHNINVLKLISKIKESKTYRKRVTRVREDWSKLYLERSQITSNESLYSSKYIEMVMKRYHQTVKWRPVIEQEMFIGEMIKFCKMLKIPEEKYNITISNLNQLMIIAQQLPRKHVIELEAYTIKSIIMSMPENTCTKEEMIEVTDNYKIQNIIANTIARIEFDKEQTVRVKKKKVMRLTASGEIKTFDERIIIYDSQSNPMETYIINSAQLTTLIFEETPDDFIKKIMQVTNIIIVDVDNVIKAMRVGKTELAFFLKYLSSWGITSIQVTTSGVNPIEGIEVNVEIPTHDHDDIAMMVMSRVHNTAILTSDTHSEFMELFTYCETHRTLQTRFNEPCTMCHTNDCKLQVLKQAPIGKIVIRDVIVRNDKLITFKSTDRVIERFTIPIKKVNTKYNPIMNRSDNFLMTRYWTLPQVSVSGPVPVASHQLKCYKQPVSIIRTNLATIAMTSICTNKAIGIIQVLCDLGSSGLSKLREKLKTKLDMKSGKMIVVDNETNTIMSQTIATNTAANLYTKQTVTVFARKHKAAIAINGLSNITQINDDMMVNRGTLNINDSSLYMTSMLLEENLALVEDKQKLFIVLVSKELVSKLQENAIAALKSKTNAIGDLVYLLPLTSKIKQAITQQYTSDDLTVQTGMSADYSLQKGRWHPGLSRYFTEVDADKPSTQLMAAPEDTSFVLSTIGLPVEGNASIKSVIELSGLESTLSYYRSSIAMTVYTQWVDYNAFEKVIRISTVHWTAAKIHSLNCTPREIDFVRQATHEIIEVMIRDTTRDVLNLFNSIAQGYTNVFLPPLVRATKCRSIKVADDGPPVKLQIEWALPTCSVITRMIISNDPEKTVMSVLVSVSPPITHNYIAAIYNSDLVLENEYNVSMCEQVQNETDSLYEYIMDKMDYFNIYVAAYGIYSLGLKMLGLDPIEIILKSSSVIEHGVSGAALTMTPSSMVSVVTQAHIYDFIDALVGNKEIKRLQLTIINKRWAKYADTHQTIKVLAKYIKMKDQRAALIAWTIGCVIVGRNTLVKHLHTCCRTNKISDNKLFAEIYNMLNKFEITKLMVQQRCILRETSIVPPMILPNVFSEEDFGMSTTFSGAKQTIAVHAKQNYQPHLKLSEMYNVVNYVPSYGSIELLLIRHTHQKHNKITRNSNLLRNLQLLRPVYITRHTKYISNINEFIAELQAIIKVANSSNSNIILLGFDKLGSFYKLAKPEEKQTIYVPKTMVIHIPDQLLYNAVRYDICQQILSTSYDEIIASSTNDKVVITEEKISNTNDNNKTIETMYENKDLIIRSMITMLCIVLLTFYWPYVVFLLHIPRIIYGNVFVINCIKNYKKIRIMTFLRQTRWQQTICTLITAEWYLNLITYMWWIIIFGVVATVVQHFYRKYINK